MKRLLLTAVCIALCLGVSGSPRGVRFDARTSGTVTTGSTVSVSHTPRGNRISGVVVFCIVEGISTDPFTAATYGGTDMGAALNSGNDTSGELGFVEVYFLGTSLSTLQGTRTAACTTADATNDKVVLVYTLNADASSTSSAGSCNVSVSTTQDDPTCTISSITRESLAVSAMWSGIGTIGNVTAESDSTKRSGNTIGTGTFAAQVQNFMQSGGNNAVQFITTVADDVGMVAVAVQQ